MMRSRMTQINADFFNGIDPSRSFRKHEEFPGIVVLVLSCSARLRTGRMGDFFAELKRRHIYRVGAGYAVVAWLVAQGVDLLTQGRTRSRRSTR